MTKKNINPVNKSIRNLIYKKKSYKKNLPPCGISIITVTNRPNYMNNVFNNYLRQSYKKKELIIILNNNECSINEYKNKFKNQKDVPIYQIDENISLGECLNYGVSKSKYDIVGKFDDDDYYSKKYLSDSVKEFKKHNVKVVGKAAYFVYFKKSKILALRMPQYENKMVTFINGATLLFKKDIFEKISFADITLGEDVQFCKDCIKNNINIYSSSRYNHVVIRASSTNHHTYKIDDKDFLKCCAVIAKTDNFIRYIERNQ